MKVSGEVMVPVKHGSVNFINASEVFRVRHHPSQFYVKQRHVVYPDTAYDGHDEVQHGETGGEYNNWLLAGFIEVDVEIHVPVLCYGSNRE